MKLNAFSRSPDIETTAKAYKIPLGSDRLSDSNYESKVRISLYRDPASFKFLTVFSYPHRVDRKSTRLNSSHS